MISYYNYKLINENYDLAKKILKEKNIERSSVDFKEIEEMLKKSIGWIGLFTKFRFVDNESFDFLQDIFNKLKTLKPILSKLPIDILKYGDVDEQGNNLYGAEKLYDDLIKIEKEHVSKKIMDEFPAEQKDLCKDIDNIQELLVEISNLPDKSDFIKKVSRYHTSKDLKNALFNFIDSSGSNSFENILIKLKKDPDIQIIKTDKDNGIIFVRILSFNACNKNMGNTSWCIANTERMWNSYVTYKTKQFAVYNTLKDADDVMRLIGFTYDVVGKISNSHAKDDTNILDKIDEYLEEVGITKEDYNFSNEETKKILDILEKDGDMKNVISTYINLKIPGWEKYAEKLDSITSNYDLYSYFEKITDDDYSIKLINKLSKLDLHSDSKFQLLKGLKTKSKQFINKLFNDDMIDLYDFDKWTYAYNSDKNWSKTIIELAIKHDMFDKILNKIKTKNKDSQFNFIAILLAYLPITDSDKITEVMEYVVENFTIKQNNVLLNRIIDVDDKFKEKTLYLLRHFSYFKLVKTALLDILNKINANSDEFNEFVDKSKKLTNTQFFKVNSNKDDFAELLLDFIKDLKDDNLVNVFYRLFFDKLNADNEKIIIYLLKNIKISPEVATKILNQISNDIYVDLVNNPYKEIITMLMNFGADATKLYKTWHGYGFATWLRRNYSTGIGENRGKFLSFLRPLMKEIPTIQVQESKILSFNNFNKKTS